MAQQILTVAPGDQGPEVARLTTFLNDYGYMPPAFRMAPTDRSRFDDAVSEALARYQRLHALPETGLLDEETQRWLNTPRCGIADAIDGLPRALFVNRSHGWGRRQITFTADLLHDVPSVGTAVVGSEIATAFNTWALAGNLRFGHAQPADIFIVFRRGDHGDGDPRLAFDQRQGGRLGHAFPPRHPALAGQVHLDADEHWSVSLPVTGSADLPTLLLHEIGHALGLEHNLRDPTAVMHERFEIGGERRTLSVSDANAIREVYPPSLT